ncbi:MAG: hypothetical protein ACOCRK_01700 [bacterium]
MNNWIKWDFKGVIKIKDIKILPKSKIKFHDYSYSNQTIIDKRKKSKTRDNDNINFYEIFHEEINKYQ